MWLWDDGRLLLWRCLEERERSSTKNDDKKDGKIPMVILKDEKERITFADSPSFFLCQAMTSCCKKISRSIVR